MIGPTTTMPTEAPTTVPATVTPDEAPMVEPATIPAVKPDVWEMPNEGSGWCDCGEDHPVDKPLVRSMIRAELGEGAENRDAITHPEVCRVIMRMWRYVEVCAFFHDAVGRSAKVVNGRAEAEYPMPVGMEIIAYFAKTWNGCPEELCGGGFGSEGPIDG